MGLDGSTTQPSQSELELWSIYYLGRHGYQLLSVMNCCFTLYHIIDMKREDEMSHTLILFVYSWSHLYSTIHRKATIGPNPPKPHTNSNICAFDFLAHRAVFYSSMTDISYTAHVPVHLSGDHALLAVSAYPFDCHLHNTFTEARLHVHQTQVLSTSRLSFSLAALCRRPSN